MQHPCSAMAHNPCKSVGRQLAVQQGRSVCSTSHVMPQRTFQLQHHSSSLQRSAASVAALSSSTLPQQQQQQQQHWRSTGHCWARHSSTTARAAASTIEQEHYAGVADVQKLRSQLQLYNTMSRKKEQFRPRPGMGDKVQMYVCGVTVYDYSHIGHARVYVAFDVLYRLLQHLQYDVQYVRNFTDIDDKIINRAAESGEDPLALSQRFIHEFHKDMVDLGCLPPTIEPKATDFIPAMIETISKIIDNGHAYTLPEGDVYFDVASLPGYGRLSGRSQEDNRAGERVAVDSRKRGPADFALWKSAKPGEPSWASPWGPGRPGWHIECSSMIAAIMGDVIDIHGGGRDLVFPHHENERAQSQAAAGPCNCGHHSSKTHDGASDGASDHTSSAAGGPEFVRYWLHNGFVNVDSEKMSKSLGNFFTIRDVLKLYHPVALRWFLVTSQYRAPVNYTQKALDDASDRVYYIFQTLADVATLLEGSGEAGAAAVAAAAPQGSSSSSSSISAAGVGGELLSSVVAALLDDLNTPAAVSALSAPLKAINDLMTTKAGRKNPRRLQLLAEYQAGLLSSLQLLGLSAADLEATLQDLKALALTRAGVTQQEVEERIAARAGARSAKDFAAADAVRVELAAKGIMLMDTPQGTTWRPGLPEATQ